MVLIAHQELYRLGMLNLKGKYQEVSFSTTPLGVVLI